MISVGLDYHTERSYVSVMDEEGNEVWDGELGTVGELPRFLESLPEARVLFEAGYGWPRLARLLEDSSVELMMCHAEENRRIATDRRKSDRRDARNLAVYLKTGAYKPAYMPPAEVRDERQLVRGRTYMVQKMTRLKNQIQSLLAYAGVPKEGMNIFAKKNRDYLESVEVPELTREVLDANIEAMDLQGELLKRMDSRIAEMNRGDPRARLLKTIPGVGEVTARVLLAEIGDVGRFKTAKALACYAGLTPRQRQSGNTMRAMGITKEGSAHLRWVLVQAAWIAIRRDPALRQFYEKLQAQKGAATAVCAVARKLAVAAWHVLTKQVPYRARKPEAKGKPEVARGKSAAGG
jgi:transposase